MLKDKIEKIILESLRLLKEYEKEDIRQVLSDSDKFNIAFEVELDVGRTGNPRAGVSSVVEELPSSMILEASPYNNWIEMAINSEVINNLAELALIDFLCWIKIEKGISNSKDIEQIVDDVIEDIDTSALLPDIVREILLSFKSVRARKYTELFLEYIALGDSLEGKNLEKLFYQTSLAPLTSEATVAELFKSLDRFLETGSLFPDSDLFAFYLIGFENNILKPLKNAVMVRGREWLANSGVIGESIEERFRIHFPKTYSKYGSVLKYEVDISLNDGGIEVSPKTYFTSINEAFDFITLLFGELRQQSTFFLSEKTGLHINISHGQNKNLNLFKGYLFLDEKTATEGFENRLLSKFSQSIKKVIEDFFIRDMQRAKRAAKFQNEPIRHPAIKDAYEAFATRNFTLIETAMRTLLQFSVKYDTRFGAPGEKRVGFHVQDNYIEFRYPGGDISLESLKAATLYYCYLIKLMSEPEFKEKEYKERVISYIVEKESWIH